MRPITGRGRACDAAAAAAMLSLTWACPHHRAQTATGMSISGRTTLTMPSTRATRSRSTSVPKALRRAPSASAASSTTLRLGRRRRRRSACRPCSSVRGATSSARPKRLAAPRRPTRTTMLSSRASSARLSTTRWGLESSARPPSAPPPRQRCRPRARRCRNTSRTRCFRSAAPPHPRRAAPLRMTTTGARPRASPPPISVRIFLETAAVLARPRPTRRSRWRTWPLPKTLAHPPKTLAPLPPTRLTTWATASSAWFRGHARRRRAQGSTGLPSSRTSRAPPRRR